jgi:hypothetical protein
MSDDPPNIQEFNMIAGLIFAQLYKAFPGAKSIDREGIAKAMGNEDGNYAAHKLPSGRSLSEAVAFTIHWLEAEGYTRTYGAFPREAATLTTKGLAAMDAVPEGLKEKLGVELTEAVDKAPSGIDLSRIGDLIGGALGGFSKSMGGG